MSILVLSLLKQKQQTKWNLSRILNYMKFFLYLVLGGFPTKILRIVLLRLFILTEDLPAPNPHLPSGCGLTSPIPANDVSNEVIFTAPLRHGLIPIKPTPTPAQSHDDTKSTHRDHDITRIRATRLRRTLTERMPSRENLSWLKMHVRSLSLYIFCRPNRMQGILIRIQNDSSMLLTRRRCVPQRQARVLANHQHPLLYF